MDHERITRRVLIGGAVAVPVAVVLAGCGDDDTPLDTNAGPAPSTTTADPTELDTNTRLEATPACDDGDEETPEQTEGPYFTPNSPERSSLVDAGMAGTRLLVTGRVLSVDCKPVKRALIDVWQCDDAGEYDNEGFRLRGHLFTGSDGAYSLRTIVPGLYTGRTRHIHVKVQPPNGSVLTTQLYFPGEPANDSDGIFDERLLLDMKPGASRAQFDFVV